MVWLSFEKVGGLSDTRPGLPLGEVFAFWVFGFFLLAAFALVNGLVYLLCRDTCKYRNGKFGKLGH